MRRALRSAQRLLADPSTPFVAAGFAVALQLPGLFSDFTYDDKLICTNNPRFASWGVLLPKSFGTDWFGGDPGIATAYRPLTMVSLGAQSLIRSDHPADFRVVNLVLHALIVLLVAAFVRRVIGTSGKSGSAGVAGAAALLFAAHPVHVEAVTSIVGRAELLSAVFVLATLALLAPMLSGPVRILRLSGAALLFLAAMFSKENAVAVPPLLLIEAHFGARSAASGRRRVVRAFLLSLALVPPLALSFLVRHRVLGGWLKGKDAVVWRLDNPLVDFEGFERAARALRVLVLESARAATLGWPLRSDASWGELDLGGAPSSPSFLLPALVLALLLAFVRPLAARRNALAAGILLFLIAPAPTSNVFFTAGTIYAERVLYLPSIGIALCGGWLLVRALASPRAAVRTGGAAAAGIALVAWSGLTAIRSTVWRNDLTLYEDQLRTSPGSARTHYNAGTVYFAAKRYAVAKREFLRAAEILPEYYTAWDAAGRVAWNEGKLDEARAHFAEASRRHWRYLPSWEALADLEVADGREEDALDVLRRGLDAMPGQLELLRREVRLRRENGSRQEARSAALALARASTLAADRDSARQLIEALPASADRDAALRELEKVTNGPRDVSGG